MSKKISTQIAANPTPQICFLFGFINDNFVLEIFSPKNSKFYQKIILSHFFHEFTTSADAVVERTHTIFNIPLPSIQYISTTRQQQLKHSTYHV